MLVDSSSSGSFIDKHLVHKLGIPKIKLPHPKLLVNANHSMNKQIIHVMWLDICIGPVKDSVCFAIANLRKSGAFLGFDWLEHLNPIIDWRKRHATFSTEPLPCDKLLEDGDRVLWIDLEAHAAWLTVWTTIDKTKPSPLNLVPEHLHGFSDIFLKEGFNELPPHCEWDHAIELVPGAKLRDCKIYPLSPGQQCELDSFIEENLASHRI